MPTRDETSHRRRDTSHKIDKISYEHDVILCVCGWEGAIDDLKEHQDTSPPTDKRVSKMYLGTWMPDPKSIGARPKN